MDNTAVDTTKTLTTDKINEAKAEVKTQVSTPFVGISNNRKQTFQQDPVETKKIVDEKVAQTTTEVKEETEKQLENTEDDTVEALVETEPIEEILNKKWSSFTFSIINNGELEQGGVSNEINTDVILNNSLNLINTETTNSAENKIQMLLGDKFATARAEQVKKLNVGDFMVEFTAESISYKIDHATGLKRSTISYSYKILEKKKFPVSVVTSTGQFSGLGDSYNVSDISTIKTIQKEIKKDVKAFIKLA